MITVVGAGIVGASVAYHLARAGAAVTLTGAGLRGATGSSFGWIGDDADGHWPGGAQDLRPLALDAYRRLTADVPGAAVRWTGSHSWTRTVPGPPGLDREPHLSVTPQDAVYRPRHGGVDPAGTTRALIEAARKLGARIETGAVTSPRPPMVLAAGTGIPALGVDLPIRSSPALLVRADGPPGLVRTIVATPEFEVRELRDGHLLMTAPLPGPPRAAPPPTGQPPAGSPGEAATRAVDRLRAVFDGDVRLRGWSVGQRPMPDGGPIIGFAAPGVYVAVMHSAVTLAPAAGRLIAAELTTGVRPPELTRCAVRPPGSHPGATDSQRPGSA